MTDRERNLIIKCQNGDYDAFEELVRAYSDRAYSVAFGVMGNHHDASDMTQDAFIKVYKNIGKFNFQSSFNTWLYRIVKNTCIDELRKNKRRNIVSIDAGIEGNEGDYLMQISDDSADIQGILEAEESSRILMESLELLGEKHRSVLVLADVKGYDYLEVARMLELPVGTVKSRISRAREKLAVILKSKGTF
ncbi:MAG: sigma-70 family RNA polymerase sigma factor [Clostridia bacterium]|nr:sigma-70 family RNA polymerase sigma factor [Clostridia bacterium]MBN2882740.1 sigma-70 family RNA polymerase sigma factor [Clostridia bacterium]